MFAVSTQVQPSCSFTSEDVVMMLDEIEQTRNTLAEIQALSLEIGHATGDGYAMPKEESVDLDSLTSKQWLDVGGTLSWPMNKLNKNAWFYCCCCCFNPDEWT